MRIKLTDLDMRADHVTVHGKGDRVRILPFGAKTGTSLERYLRLRAKHKLAKLPELWLGSRGQGMTTSGVTQMLERRAGMAGSSISIRTCSVMPQRRMQWSTAWVMTQ